MDNILKKALDEAYTSKWAAELDNCEDMGHEFSQSFDIKMRQIVRKARHPLLFYTNYIAAAAACAVIAVGASFIIPALNSANVPVDKNASVTSDNISQTIAVEIPVEEQPVSDVDDADYVTESDDAVNTADTDDNAVSVPVPAQDDDNDGNEEISEPSAGSVTDITSTPPDAVMNATEVDIPDEEIPPYTDTTIYNEPNDFGPENNDTEWPDIKPADASDASATTEIKIKDTAEEDVTVDVVADEEEDDDSDDDYEDVGGTDIIETSDDDANPATGGGGNVGYDSDDDDDDDNDESFEDDNSSCGAGIPSVDVGKRYPYPESATLGELFGNIAPNVDYGGLTVHSGNFVTGGKSISLYADSDYLNVFLRNSADSKFFSREITPTASYIKLWVYDVPIYKPNISLTNHSQWLYYDNLYYGGIMPDEIDVDVDDDDIEDYTFMAALTVYKNGVISVDEALCEGKRYSDKMYFKADDAIVTKLFESASRPMLPSGASTAGELAAAMNITSGNIRDAVMNVEGVYDSWIDGMKVSGDAIAELFAENSGQRISSLGNSGRFIFCSFTLSDPAARVRLSVTSDKCIIRTYYGDETAFPITKASYEKLLASAARQNGLDIPIYNTLEDFLKNKNFSALEDTYVRNFDIKYTVPKGEETEAVFDAMKSELPNAVYCVNKYERNSLQYVCLSIKDWSYVIMIFSDDTVQIGWNVFQASPGFYSRIKKLITESPNVYAEYMFKPNSFCTEEQELPTDTEYETDFEDDVEILPENLPTDENPVTDD